MELRPGYKQTEVGVIPEEWEMSTVGREFEIQLGKMLDAEKNRGVPKPYVGNRAVQWGRIDVDNLSTMAMSRTDLERYRLRLGDLLVCEGGEVGRAAVWEAPISECYYQKALHRLRARRGFYPQFMLELLQWSSDHGLLTDYVAQTSIAHLTREKLAKVPLPVPQPEEQRAIVTVIRDVDALLAALERLIAKKRDLKQAAMQQLLTGWKRLSGFSGEWEVKRLGDIGTFTKGKGITKDQVVADGLPCVRYGEIYTHYNDYIREFHSFIRKEVAKDSQRLRAGDLLFTGSGETAEEIGKCVTFVGHEEAYAGGDIVIHSPEGQDSTYLGYLMNHTSMTEQKSRMGQGDAIVHISARNLGQLRLRLPRRDEQTAVAGVLSDMDAEIAALEARLAKTRALKQGMMQELLTGKTRLI